MTAGQITDAGHLRTLPDGTIISWLRIPGDQTSAAVAFVRREVEYPTFEYAREHPNDAKPVVTVWLSPGGWDPMSIEQAGVTFPCQIVRWGEGDYASGSVDPQSTGLWDAIQTIDKGGTWFRETALRAAVDLFRGDSLYVLPRNGEGPMLGPVLATAEAFEDWLRRDEQAEALNIDTGIVTEEQAHRAYASWLDRDAAADGEPTAIIVECVCAPRPAWGVIDCPAHGTVNAETWRLSGEAEPHQ